MPPTAKKCHKKFCERGINLQEPGPLSKELQQHLSEYHMPEGSCVDDDENSFHFRRNNNWEYVCVCGNKYKPSNSMSRHLKKDDCELIDEVLKNALDTKEQYEPPYITITPNLKKRKLDQSTEPLLASIMLLVDEVKKMREGQERFLALSQDTKEDLERAKGDIVELRERNQ
ncbi:hypothetical protein BGX27_005472, partial [Mortierella sp. AM989]